MLVVCTNWCFIDYQDYISTEITKIINRKMEISRRRIYNDCQYTWFISVVHAFFFLHSKNVLILICVLCQSLIDWDDMFVD